MKGAIFSASNSTEEGIIDLLKQAMDKDCFQAILMSVKVPAGDSFAYLLIQDKLLLKNAYPLPPIMPAQGARALSSVTSLGKASNKVAAIMRPCEIRAAIELYKLGQINLENVILISVDCPGVLPLSLYLEDPKKGTDVFEDVLKQWGNEYVRPACKVCNRFSLIAGDLHIGILGSDDGKLFLIANTTKGQEILDTLGMSEASVGSWKAKVKEISEKRAHKRNEFKKELKSKVGGLDNLLETFSNCINCHNCMSACPICYCRQCYFESSKVKFPAEDYLMRAEKKGSIRFLPDTLLFHIGRMSHMTISCVSCGTCEDACPMSIPIAQIFGMVADETQRLFDYLPGRNIEESLPLITYKEEELHEVEDTGE